MTTCRAWTTTCCAAARPTCHVEFDEPTALLVGDSLQTLAFELLAGQPAGDPAGQLEMIALLAHASGSRGMAGGQAIDLAAVGKALDQPELELMHALKTGALIRAAILLGALSGEPLAAGEREGLDRFAKRAGLLFQVVDDILDCTASTATLGKTAGKDEAADEADLCQPARPRRRPDLCRRAAQRRPRCPCTSSASAAPD